MSLPGADELFRATIEDDANAPTTADATSERAAEAQGSAEPQAPAESAPERAPTEPAPVASPRSALREPPPESSGPQRSRPEPEGTDGSSARRPSGRVRHDEKMTVYVTAEELLDIEHARLALRRSAGRAVDRGRLVRAAVAMALADFDANGDDSDLVRRLRGA